MEDQVVRATVQHSAPCAAGDQLAGLRKRGRRGCPSSRCRCCWATAGERVRLVPGGWTCSARRWTCRRAWGGAAAVSSIRRTTGTDSW